ncbi:uncharacterized protein LOC142322962 [Lycorma delicatula]|uniref:uncharacterized protein LOC142322962 n=1 Tax=Lycorma delicatula TaxID=130591 RepID=UPI003F515F5A
MVYAIIGVPLMLICLSNLGSLLAEAFQCLYAYTCTCICCDHSSTESLSHVHRHIAVDDDADHVSSNKKTRRECDGNGPRTAPHPRSTLVAVGSRCGKPVCSLTPETHQQFYNKNPDYSQNDSEDEEPDNSRGSMVTHDTPSRMPLIWRNSPRRAPTPPPPFRTSSSSSATVPTSIRVPPILVLLVLIVYISIGSIVFASWENWSYLDSAYFCFVTLSTIGFGDLVPGKSLQISGSDSKEGHLQLIACCIYLLFGLAVIAMCFSLMQDEIAYRSRQLAVYFGLMKKSHLDV